MLPPSDKFSMLRGLSSSAVTIGSSGENNLAFKCMRKRLVFETLHLDLEGGVGERRTTPSMAVDAGMTHTAGVDAPGRAHPPNSALPARAVKLEAPVPARGSADHCADSKTAEQVAENTKTKRSKKKVAFQSERPDLYDF
jgi:elongator complex protein 4